jgi:3'(2'), 5'-bisphosphate nucleotidase
MSDFIDQHLLHGVIAVAQTAGEATLPYFFREKELSKQQKADDSVVTRADLASDQLVREGLFQLDGTVPILTEETANEFPWSERKKWSAYWLVDPLDGTRGFVEGDASYTVNIALVIDNRPRLGVIYSPVNQFMYYGVTGEGASVMRSGHPPELLCTAALNWQAIRVVSGHFHDNQTHFAQLAQNKAVGIEHINSSYKLCVIASGEQDIYPKFTETSEWDTAAGQVILEEAGGALVDVQGRPLTYNTKDSLINPSFLALGDASQVEGALKFVFSS